MGINKNRDKNKIKGYSKILKKNCFRIILIERYKDKNAQIKSAESKKNILFFLDCFNNNLLIMFIK